MSALIATLVALGTLFAAGLRVPVFTGARRVIARVAVIAIAIAATLAANVAMFKHDAHFDVTREQAFTPARETLAVLGALDRDVELVYFYQAQNPAGVAAKAMVELLGRSSERLKVQTVDPDRYPGVANRLGVKLYNAALLRSGGEQIEVVTTDDREIALGIQRLLRRDRRPVCFLTGHGEYDIDNFEFHTHFEGRHSHSHDSQGMALVQMEQHGAGRLRRSLEKLGYGVRKISLATERTIPDACAAVAEINPRTAYGPPEVEALAAWLGQGGNLLMLLEPDFPVDAALVALLARAGVKVGDGVVSDPKSHYYTDEQMIAITAYARHPATFGLALSFFPGARPVSAVAAPGVAATELFTTSAESRVLPRQSAEEVDHHALQHERKSPHKHEHPHKQQHQDQQKRSAPKAAPAGSRSLAVASHGRLDGAEAGKPFRLVVIGDADFASNSFFPYLSNADLVIGLVAWLRGEERGPAAKPPTETLPMVVLTNDQMRSIFILCVLVLPGLMVLAGLGVWWRRRY
jgi:hypothetical protein